MQVNPDSQDPIMLRLKKLSDLHQQRKELQEQAVRINDFHPKRCAYIRLATAWYDFLSHSLIFNFYPPVIVMGMALKFEQCINNCKSRLLEYFCGDNLQAVNNEIALKDQEIEAVE